MNMISKLMPHAGRSLLAGLMFSASGFAVTAQDYPTEPVTLVVPFVPGGMVDASARILAEKLSSSTGQQFIVENQPGAAGNIGYANVARGKADGYTVLYGYSTTSTCAPAVNPKLNWKPSDFVSVGSFAGFPMMITIHPSIPATTLPELVAYLKENPGEVSFATLGVGSQVHIATEVFKMMADVEMEPVHYKGSGEVISDLLAGNVQLVFDAYGPYRQHIAAGKLLTLAVADTKRDPGAPEIPTTEEGGLPGLVQTGFMPMFVPATTDPGVIEALTKAIAEASQDPDMQAKVTNVKLNNDYVTPEALQAQLEQLTSQCAEVVEKAGIRVE